MLYVSLQERSWYGTQKGSGVLTARLFSKIVSCVEKNHTALPALAVGLRSTCYGLGPLGNYVLFLQCLDTRISFSVSSFMVALSLNIRQAGQRPAFMACVKASRLLNGLSDLCL